LRGRSYRKTRDDETKDAESPRDWPGSFESFLRAARLHPEGRNGTGGHGRRRRRVRRAAHRAL